MKSLLLSPPCKIARRFRPSADTMLPFYSLARLLWKAPSTFSTSIKLFGFVFKWTTISLPYNEVVIIPTITFDTSPLSANLHSSRIWSNVLLDSSFLNPSDN